MTSSLLDTGVELRPRLLVTAPIHEEYRVSVSTRLLGTAATFYGLGVDDINPVSILATHERKVTTSRTTGTSEEFGSFTRTLYRTADDTQEEDLSITVRLTPHTSASQYGYVVHNGYFETKKDVLNINLSATLVHELGHLAVHKGTRNPFKISRFLIPRYNMPAAVRKYKEEDWVRQRTIELMKKRPELEHLLTAQKR